MDKRFASACSESFLNLRLVLAGSPSPANALAASATWTSAENPSPILQPELDYDDLNPMIEVSDDSQGATAPDDDECMTPNDSMHAFLDWSTITPWGGP